MVKKRIDELNSDMKELIDSGYFGEETKRLLELNNKEDKSEGFYSNVKDLFEDFKNLQIDDFFLMYLNEFIKIINDAFEVNPDECLKIPVYMFIGTNENENLEITTSYNKYIRSMKELGDVAKEAEDNPNLANKIKLADKLLDTFSITYEYSLKLIPFITALKKISKNEEFSLVQLSGQFGKRKIEQFVKFLNGEHKLLSDVWDVRLRNAQNHNDIDFDSKSGLFKGKYTHSVNKQKKIEDFEESPEMVYGRIVQLNMFNQGIIAAFQLLYLNNNNNDLYKELIDYINN